MVHSRLRSGSRGPELYHDPTHLMMSTMASGKNILMFLVILLLLIVISETDMTHLSAALVRTHLSVVLVKIHLSLVLVRTHISVVLG